MAEKSRHIKGLPHHHDNIGGDVRGANHQLEDTDEGVDEPLEGVFFLRLPLLPSSSSHSCSSTVDPHIAAAFHIPLHAGALTPLGLGGGGKWRRQQPAAPLTPHLALSKKVRSGKFARKRGK